MVNLDKNLKKQNHGEIQEVKLWGLIAVIYSSAFSDFLQ